MRRAKEKEILRETWWLDVLGTGTFHLISVDEFNILFPSMSSTDLVTVWIDRDKTAIRGEQQVLHENPYWHGETSSRDGVLWPGGIVRS